MSTRPPDRFVWYPLVVASVLWLLTIAPVPWAIALVFVAAPLFLIAAAGWVIGFILALFRLHWRAAAGFILAPVFLCTATVAEIVVLDQFRLQHAPASAVASPSGRVTAIRVYGEETPGGIYLVTRHFMVPFASFLYSNELVTLSWTDDHHLVIGAPSGTPIEAGPTQFGDINISYVPYKADLDQASPKDRQQASITNVRYRFVERIGTPTPSGRQ